MVIDRDAVVSIHYRLSEAGGVIEESFGAEPLVYLHGHGGLLAGVEDALVGKQAGEQVSVTLPPERAYGLRDEAAIVRVPKSHVVGDAKNRVYKPGMVVRVNADGRARAVVVIKAGLKMLDVDANHPLAGRTLTFDVEVVGVRPASAEEIAHGHVHGTGGVDH